MAFTYVLRCADGSFYCGSTEQLDARIAKHQDGSASVYTAARRPVTLAYVEEHASIEVARQRERQFKGWSRAKKAALASGRHRDLKCHSQSSTTSQRSAAVAPLTEGHPIFRLMGAGRGGGNTPGARDKHAIPDASTGASKCSGLGWPRTALQLVDVVQSAGSGS